MSMIVISFLKIIVKIFACFNIRRNRRNRHSYARRCAYSLATFLTACNILLFHFWFQVVWFFFAFLYESRSYNVLLFVWIVTWFPSNQSLHLGGFDWERPNK